MDQQKKDLLEALSGAENGTYRHRRGVEIKG